MFAKIRNALNARTGIVTIIVTSVFLLAFLLGEGILQGWGSNTQCYKYLGCTNGFFGFDAIEHFLFGIMTVWTWVWIFHKFPQFSLAQNKFWKNILVLLALTIFISLLWEFVECIYDLVRVEIFREPLFNLRLHINLLAQPSNLDTMGDFAFCLLGAITSVLFVDLEENDFLEAKKTVLQLYDKI